MPRSINDEMLEQNVVDKVKEYAKRRGWLHRKITYTGRRGAPDDWFFGHGARLVIIEFKRPKKSATEQQAREHDRFTERGFRVYVVNDIEAGKSLFRRLDAEDLT